MIFRACLVCNSAVLVLQTESDQHRFSRLPSISDSRNNSQCIDLSQHQSLRSNRRLPHYAIAQAWSIENRLPAGIYPPRNVDWYQDAKMHLSLTCYGS
ncbi:hypothetical protein VTN00DRAFT_3548 [Thermoascus crustaceus]|uniref:uncharacterized protein n=1 Tax=Thermoascus crustaceus TaxID=5088 RepID=UPI00374275ED